MLRSAAGLALVLCASACSVFQSEPPVRIDSDGPDLAARWNGRLNTTNALEGVVAMSGTVWMAEEDGKATVSLDISNAAPGGIHPWVVYRGRCNASYRLALGSEDAYPPLEVSGRGTATAVAHLDATPLEGEEYAIAILAAPNNRNLVIACGNLAPPSR